jgi:membrane glycosyltransferase
MDRMIQGRAASPDRRTRGFLPPDAPLAMPPQRLRGAEAAHALRANSAQALPARPRGLALRRVVVFGATIAATAAAGYEMFMVFEVGGLTVLEGIVLALFVVLFAWISLSCVSACAGFVLELLGPATRCCCRLTTRNRVASWRACRRSTSRSSQAARESSSISSC